MKTIWVYENIQEDLEFYSKFNILLLLSSVSLWKRNHPSFHCVLYCDNLTKEILSKINGLNYWDEIIEYKHTLNIDRKIFWACNKVKVLSEQKEPCIILDHDSLVYKPISNYLKDKVIVSNLEKGKGYYPNNLDPYIKQLKRRIKWPSSSLNVSFLYFPNPNFLQKYSSTSLSLMEEFTKIDVPNSQYLIFAEQLLLKYLMDQEGIEYKSLISTYWDCLKWEWGKSHSKGIWKYPKSNLYYWHYGPLKSIIINNSSQYEEEMKKLKNCINDPNIDLSVIKNK